MGKQVNKYGYDERSTKIMLATPITELSRFIGAKWYLTLEKLSEQSGVPINTIKNAVSGKKIMPSYEKRLRDFLGKL